MDTRSGEVGSYEALSQYVKPEELLELTEAEFRKVKGMTLEERISWAKSRPKAFEKAAGN